MKNLDACPVLGKISIVEMDRAFYVLATGYGILF
jgi:hypothetical protein